MLLKEDDILEFRDFISRNYNENYIFLNNTFFNHVYKNYLSTDYTFKIFKVKNAIVAISGYIPCILKCFDKKIETCFMTNLMVEERLRNLGLGPRIILGYEKQFDFLLVSHYGGGAHLIYEKFNWVIMTKYKRYFKILSSEKCSILAQKKITIDHPSNNTNLNNQNFKFEKIDQFNQDINDFWNKVKDKYPICVNRSQEYLNWRYSDYPILKYHIFLVRKDEDIRAFIILRIEELDDFKIGRIIDFISFDDAEDFTLRSIIKYCKDNNFDLLDFIFTGNFHLTTLKNLKFKHSIEEPYSSIPLVFNPIQRERKMGNFTFKIVKDDLKDDRINDFNNWYLTKGDGDMDRPN